METSKIKSPVKINLVVTFNSWESKTICSPDIVTQKYSEPEVFSYATTSSRYYSSLEETDSDIFDDWCKHINAISIDLKKEFDPSTEALKLHNYTNSNNWKDILSEFMMAVQEHKENQSEFKQTHSISIESARRFLFLVPILATYRPRVYIDASNGCFNVDMTTRDNGILSTQISDNGQIHYSYVSQNKKIFKITGTAKFKDSRDFIKFNKILQMI